MSSSTFRLTTAFRHGRTKIDDVYFEAPFKLMTPFANGRRSGFIVMLASPGFLKGDEAHIAIDFAPGTDSTIRTQSYEKVLDTADGEASRTIDLTARGDAKAVFLPFPVIPFRGSAFMNQTTARISAESTFVYGDVVTCGRVGMGERWAMRRFANRMRVFVSEPLAVAQAREAAAQSAQNVQAADSAAADASSADPSAAVAPAVPQPTRRRGRPPKPRRDADADAVRDVLADAPRERLAFADRLLLEPDAFDYEELGMWREFTHCGVAYVHLPELDPAAAADSTATPDSAATPEPADADAVRARVEAARVAAEDALIDRIRDHARAIGFVGELGVSRAIDGICVRLLTSRGDDAFDFIRDVADMAMGRR